MTSLLERCAAAVPPTPPQLVSCKPVQGGTSPPPAQVLRVKAGEQFSGEGLSGKASLFIVRQGLIRLMTPQGDTCRQVERSSARAQQAGGSHAPGCSRARGPVCCSVLCCLLCVKARSESC